MPYLLHGATNISDHGHSLGLIYSATDISSRFASLYHLAGTLALVSVPSSRSWHAARRLLPGLPSLGTRGYSSSSMEARGARVVNV